MQKLKTLLDQQLVFNLYRNEALITEAGLYSEDDLIEWEAKHGDAFRDHLYAFNLKGIGSEKIFDFLNEKMPKGYYEVMFEAGMHHPIIGIYNSAKNELIGIGIGRKNNLFITTPGGLIKNDELAPFTEMDYGNVVSSLIDSLEEAANYHWDSANVDNEDEDADDQQSIYAEEMDVAYNLIPIAIPTMPDSIGDVSPGDF